jgi:hypothetical protein
MQHSSLGGDSRSLLMLPATTQHFSTAKMVARALALLLFFRVYEGTIIVVDVLCLFNSERGTAHICFGAAATDRGREGLGAIRILDSS